MKADGPIAFRRVGLMIEARFGHGARQCPPDITSNQSQCCIQLGKFRVNRTCSSYEASWKKFRDERLRSSSGEGPPPPPPLNRDAGEMNGCHSYWPVPPKHYCCRHSCCCYSRRRPAGCLADPATADGGATLQAERRPMQQWAVPVYCGCFCAAR